jgi:hypothetical protein
VSIGVQNRPPAWSYRATISLVSSEVAGIAAPGRLLAVWSGPPTALAHRSYGVGEHEILAFTDFGVENLVELIKIHKELKSRPET